MKLRYVEQFKDRHGKMRYYFCRTVRGRRVRVALPPPASSEFADRYAALLGCDPGALSDEAEFTRSQDSVRATVRRLNRRGFIYALGNNDVVKIGFTVNPRQRMKNLRTGSPDRYKILALVPGTKADERALHAKFKKAAVAGEWFRRTGDIDAWIQAAKNKTGAGVAKPLPQTAQTGPKLRLISG